MNTSTQDQLQRLFAAWDRADSPGCAVGIYRDGETVYTRGFGRAHLEYEIAITPGTVFHIASLSKQFTALAIALLARAGAVSLDDDVRQYLPELAVREPMTLRHLIHHTSGLRDQWSMLRLAGWREADLKTTGDILRFAARQRHLNFAPGTRFQYIDTGYTLLAVIVERVTGTSFRTYTAEHIFNPLGMHRTFFQDDYQEIIEGRAPAYSLAPDGRLRIDVPNFETVGPTGLFSTVEDFAAWERNFLAPTVGDAALIRQLVMPGYFSEETRKGYGFGLLIGEHRGLETVEHAGGDAGYRSHFLRLPSEQFAVAIFCNYAEMKPGQLAREVADICLAERLALAGGTKMPAQEPTMRIAGDVAPSLESKGGRYRDLNTGTTCEIEMREGQLFLVATGGGVHALTPVGAAHFRFVEVEEAECFFEASTEDRPARMIVKYAGQETASCERIDDARLVADWRAADYAGTYQSDELSVQYVVEATDERLILRRDKFDADPLRRQAADEFSAEKEGFLLRFVRDDAGRAQGLFVNTDQVWSVWFARL